MKAEFADWKLIKTRGVVQIILEIDLRNEHAAYVMLGGMPNPDHPVWVDVTVSESAFAGAPAHENHTQRGLSSTEKPARDPNPYLPRAGALFSNTLFHKYIEAPSVDPRTFAKDYVKHLCKVEHLSEIQPNTPAAVRFDLVESGFIAWKEGPKHGAPA